MNSETEVIRAAESYSSASEQLSRAIEDKDHQAIEFFALKLLLFSGPVHAINFAWVMQIILDHGKMSPGWKAAFEQAYDLQVLSRRILYRDSMVKLYLWFKDYHMAAKFLASKPELPEELSDAMEVYLRLKRYDDARIVAEMCGQKMVSCRDAHSLRRLVRTLRHYHRAIEEQDNERYEVLKLITSLEAQWLSRTERCNDTKEGVQHSALRD